MTREEKVSSFVTPRNLEVHEHVVFIFVEQTKCVKIMQSQSELLCEAIHERLICPEFIILLRSFPSDISLWLWLCFLSPLSGWFSSTRGDFEIIFIPRSKDTWNILLEVQIWIFIADWNLISNFKVDHLFEKTWNSRFSEDPLFNIYTISSHLWVEERLFMPPVKINNIQFLFLHIKCHSEWLSGYFLEKQFFEVKQKLQVPSRSQHIWIFEWLFSPSNLETPWRDHLS